MYFWDTFPVLFGLLPGIFHVLLNYFPSTFLVISKFFPCIFMLYFHYFHSYFPYLPNQYFPCNFPVPCTLLSYLVSYLCTYLNYWILIHAFQHIFMLLMILLGFVYTYTWAYFCKLCMLLHGFSCFFGAICMILDNLFNTFALCYVSLLLSHALVLPLHWHLQIGDKKVKKLKHFKSNS